MVSRDRKLECSPAENLIDFQIFCTAIGNHIAFPQKNMTGINEAVFYMVPQYWSYNCILDELIQLTDPRERDSYIQT